MKHLIYSLVLLFSLCSAALGQDKIFFKDGKIKEAKVIEISSSRIKFKDFHFLTGPMYIAKTSEVDKIIFENGQEKIISRAFLNSMNTMSLGRNILSYHMFDVLYAEFTVSYERISRNQKFGFLIPYSVGFNPSRERQEAYSPNIYSGFGFHYYPQKQKRWSFFIGPEIILGIASREVHYYDYHNPPSYNKKYNYVYAKSWLNNGFHYMPTENFCVSGVFGFGVRYFDYPEKVDGGFKGSLYFSLTLGYRF
ncbi:MAG: hypothetical protein K9G76_10190 [Bacteroidales bacterium]|nr:hypothetical protein [Bacteroidales bacterium]MCF8404070.1 hypothetical protein [Bacteroidales bacterium]